MRPPPTAKLFDPGPTLPPGETERLRRLERRKARCKPGSAKRRKTRGGIAKLKRRQARRLAEGYETVAVEDLDVRAMSASTKGTVDQPGSNVAQQRALNRVITGKGWGISGRVWPTRRRGPAGD